jgi:hypothetical protein
MRVSAKGFGRATGTLAPEGGGGAWNLAFAEHGPRYRCPKTPPLVLRVAAVPKAKTDKGLVDRHLKLF